MRWKARALQIVYALVLEHMLVNVSIHVGRAAIGPAYVALAIDGTDGN